MSDAIQTPLPAPVPRGRLSTRLEELREADDAAGAASESALEAALGADPRTDLGAAARSAPDYAVPVSQYRLRRRWRRRAMTAVVGTDFAIGLVAAAVSVVGLDLTARSVTGLALVSAGVWTLVLALAGVYERRSTGHGSEEFRRLLFATVGVLAVASTSVLAGAALPDGAEPLRHLALAGVPVAGGLSIAAHAGARSVLLFMRRRGRCQYRVVAVGKERSIAELVRATRRDRASGLSVVGALTHTRRGGARGAQVDGVPVLGTPAETAAAVRELNADTVLITAWSDLSQDELRRLTWELEGSGVELLVAPRLSGIATPRLHIRTVDGSPLVHVDEQEFTGLPRIVKSAFDHTVGGLLVLMLSPVLIGVAIAVKLDSPGPVLFRQERVGRGGERFRMTKFRSMYVDAEARRAELLETGDDDVDRGPLFKMRDDPRVTKVGKFIRRYSLDELPQLLDVVGGRMSLVGPRPPLPAEVEQYHDDVRRRLRVKPGMTGLWQVSGRSNLSWEDAVRLDLHYVENWSLTTDLSIMARTVAAVLARDGAY